LLEPVVGQGAIIARVTAAVDHSALSQNAEVFDPDQVALRSERKVAQNSSNQTNQPAGVAGAQANLPLQPQPQQNGPSSQGTSANNDEVKNFEISKTVTQTVARLPRLQKLSVAVVVDGVSGKARPVEEMTRLSELAKKAVGFDEVRGDQFEMTSEVFGRSPEPELKAPEKRPIWVYVAIGAGVLAALGIAVALGRKKKVDLVLQPGATVASLEAKAGGAEGMLTAGAPVEEPKPPPLVDPIADIRERARAMVRQDPERAIVLIRSWLSQDLEKGVERG
jgi:flagellar M-ring protein FliF